jgi:hypothetical protein
MKNAAKPPAAPVKIREKTIATFVPVKQEPESASALARRDAIELRADHDMLE